MRAPTRIPALIASALLLCNTLRGSPWAQQVVDRVAARVENDLILLSEVRELGGYQFIENGVKETDAQLLDRLIDQWIVRTEADASHFRPPADGDVYGELARIKEAVGAAPFSERLRQSGLSDSDLLSLIREQLYLSSYLDSRFRPSVHVALKAVEEFYEKSVVTLARQKGQQPPSLDDSREAIREALIQRGVSEQADKWLKESRARLHVEKMIP